MMARSQTALHCLKIFVLRANKIFCGIKSVDKRTNALFSWVSRSANFKNATAIQQQVHH